MLKRSSLFLVLWLVFAISSFAFASDKIAIYKVTVESDTFSEMDYRIKNSICSKLRQFDKFSFISEVECDDLTESGSKSISEAKNLSEAGKLAAKLGVNYLIGGRIYDSGNKLMMELILFDVDSGKESKKITNEVNSSYSRFVSVDLKKSLKELLS